jgi:threonine dehydrogenase-like Zn-dependent dehydrogenase
MGGWQVNYHLENNYNMAKYLSSGPVGQMCADFAFINGASRVIMIDNNWRLDFVKSKVPKVETIDYTALSRGQSITTKLKEMVHGGPDVALECVAGEYAKGWAHYFEMLLGMETDTSELLNEVITSVKNFGRCGITGVYVGYVQIPLLMIAYANPTLNWCRRIISTPARSCSVVFVSLGMDRHPYICKLHYLLACAFRANRLITGTGRSFSK